MVRTTRKPKYILDLPAHLVEGAPDAEPPKRVPGRFYIGMQFGELKLLRKIRRSRRLSPNLAIRWRCKCSCGTELTVPEYYMKRAAPKWNCGCRTSTLKSLFKEEYGIWYMMHRRTEDKNHKHYSSYGGRGIFVCDEWNKDPNKAGPEDGFRNFLEHVGPRKSRKFSIDRIDNDGPYKPGNVRWATAVEQRANQRER